MNSKQTEKGLVDILWGFFTSVRLSVIVLTLLAVTSIIGTVIPQNASPAIYLQNYGEFVYRIFRFLDIFDMYHSWWFQFLVVLLGMNLVICSLDRLPAVMKIVKKGQSLSPGPYRRASKGETLAVKDTSDALASTLIERLNRPMGSFTEVEEDGKRLFFAEKGRWTRLGVYVVHSSILLLLAGGLIGSQFGYEGHMNIPEGGSLSEVTLKGSGAKIPLDFEIRCDDFNVSFYDTGAPKEYRSDLVVLEGGQELVTKRIVVNDPLRYQGISFYQASYGTSAPERATFNFTSKASGMTYTQEGAFGETLTIPEGLGSFTPVQFSGNYQFNGHAIGATVLGTLTTAAGEGKALALPVKFAMFDRMRKGDVVISVGSFEDRYYTGLQVTKDPGVWFVYSGFILLIVGCYITFFMSHQGYLVEIEPTKKGSKVTLYGNANKNKLGMEMVIRRLTESLQKELGSPERQVKK